MNLDQPNLPLHFYVSSVISIDKEPVSDDTVVPKTEYVWQNRKPSFIFPSFAQEVDKCNQPSASALED
jgi:hypothetical protein